MASVSADYRVPRPSIRPKKSRKSRVKKQATCVPPIPPITPITHSSTPSTAHIKKPMRPLTAYHIFFQIEREHIIQSLSGPDANKSIHDGKMYIRNVPRRYRWTKLLPDWFFGPGKRQKRKHRKSHGKIGFLELSRVISKRWATLETIDPETKIYVSKIAAKELGIYKEEMNYYKASCSTVTTAAKTSVPVAMASAAPDVTTSAMMVPPSPPPPLVTSSHDLSSFFCMPVVSSDIVLSSGQEFSIADAASSCSSSDEDEIDYSICSLGNNGNYIPSPSPASRFSMDSIMIHDGSICDPLFELEDEITNTQRCVSPINVDIFSDKFLHLFSP